MCMYQYETREVTFNFRNMQEFLTEKGIAKQYWPEHWKLLKISHGRQVEKFKSSVLREMILESLSEQNLTLKDSI